jgi:pimeloyl-ACP methyl ester carboxylesterase
MASDDDIITLEHTLDLYRGIEQSELAVVPGTSHFLTQEKPDLVNTIAVDFLANDPVATVAPMRRAPTPEGEET